jgi:hypothetical protein
MDYTIGSLGGVPLGRSGTGAAVTFGKQDYSYLEPKEKKAEKYTPYTTPNDEESMRGKIGKVWSYDRTKATKIFGEWYSQAQNLEKIVKSGNAAEAEKAKKALNDKAIELEIFVADSNKMEKNYGQIKDDMRQHSVYYTPEDQQKVEDWAKDPNRLENTGYEPNIKKVPALDWAKYSGDWMDKRLSKNINTADKTIISGNVQIAKGQKYVDDNRIREEAESIASTVVPGTYWWNLWLDKMQNLAGPNNEGGPGYDFAHDFIGKSSTPEGVAMIQKYIADKTYEKKKRAYESEQVRIKPAPTPKASTGNGGGIGGKKDQGTATWVTRTQGGVDSSGQIIPDRTVWSVEIADKKSDKDEYYFVSRKYIEELAKLPEYKWLENVEGFEFLLKMEDESGKPISIQTSPNLQIKGIVKYVYHDPKKTGVDADRIIISLPDKSGVRNEIEIPLMGNVAKINQRFEDMGLESYQKDLSKNTKGKTPAPAVVPPTPTQTDAKPKTGTQATGGAGSFTIEKDGKYYSIPYTNQKEYQDKLKAAIAKGGKLIKKITYETKS